MLPHGALVLLAFLVFAPPALAEDPTHPDPETLGLERPQPRSGGVEHADWRATLRMRCMARYDTVFLVSTPVTALSLGTPMAVALVLDEPTRLELGTSGVLLLDGLATTAVAAGHASLGLALRALVIQEIRHSTDPEVLAQRWLQRSRAFTGMGVATLVLCTGGMLMTAMMEPHVVQWGHAVVFGLLCVIPTALMAEAIAHRQIVRELDAVFQERYAARNRPRITAVGPFAISGVW